MKPTSCAVMWGIAAVVVLLATLLIWRFLVLGG